MRAHQRVRAGWVLVVAGALASAAADASANEIWVAPTYQMDVGGLGVGSGFIWPVSPAGVVRFSFAVPNDLQAFQAARIVLVRDAPAAANLAVYVCRAKHADLVNAACTGPFPHALTGAANQLLEIDVSAAVGPQVGAPGLSHVAVVAWTNPTALTDHFAGMRVVYTPAVPAGVATTGANAFSGPQTAPAFVGDGSALTNLPFPAGAATTGANVFGGTQTAPAFVGSGAGLTNVAKLTANTFAGTQTITGGNLDLDSSSASAGNVRKGGRLFMHNREGGTFVGRDAGVNVVPGGSGNTGVGESALSLNTSGFDNTAIGYQALLANRTGTNNVAVGGSALSSNDVAHHNTAVGHLALSEAIGGFNTALGAAAGSQLLIGSNNIYIDNFGVSEESDTIRIGRLQARAFIRGIRGMTTGQSNAVPVVVDSAGQLGTVSSSRRYKEDIHDVDDASRRLLRLRPVSFRYSKPFADGGKPIQYGLIAEEVAEVFPELVVRDDDGRPETVQYQTLNVLLLNELQKQQARLEALERELAALRRR